MFRDAFPLISPSYILLFAHLLDDSLLLGFGRALQCIILWVNPDLFPWLQQLPWHVLSRTLLLSGIFCQVFCCQYFWPLLCVIHVWIKLPCDILRARWDVSLHKGSASLLLGRFLRVGEGPIHGVCLGWFLLRIHILWFLSCPRRLLHLFQDDLRGCAVQDSHLSVIY